jgi:hypothetical protein
VVVTVVQTRTRYGLSRAARQSCPAQECLELFCCIPASGSVCNDIVDSLQTDGTSDEVKDLDVAMSDERHVLILDDTEQARPVDAAPMCAVLLLSEVVLMLAEVMLSLPEVVNKSRCEMVQYWLDQGLSKRLLSYTRMISLFPVVPSLDACEVADPTWH